MAELKGQTSMTLLDQLKAVVTERLADLDGVVALAEEHGNLAPHLFCAGDDLSTLVLGPRYPIALTVRQLLKHHPGARLGVVARGCQERALIELANWKQLDMAQIEVIGIPCTAELAVDCRCDVPYPTQLAVGERVEGVQNPLLAEFQAAKTREQRMAFWQHQFAKCIKCYGCRNICPLCFCETCAMEDEVFVDRGRLPVPFPTFHLIKALHTAGSGKCVGCHACEDACPADIPLSLLYTLLRQDLKSTFGYDAGKQTVGAPPVLMGEGRE